MRVPSTSLGIRPCWFRPAGGRDPGRRANKHWSWGLCNTNLDAIVELSCMCRANQPKRPFLTPRRLHRLALHLRPSRHAVQQRATALGPETNGARCATRAFRAMSVIHQGPSVSGKCQCLRMLEAKKLSARLLRLWLWTGRQTGQEYRVACRDWLGIGFRRDGRVVAAWPDSSNLGCYRVLTVVDIAVPR